MKKWIYKFYWWNFNGFGWSFQHKIENASLEIKQKNEVSYIFNSLSKKLNDYIIFFKFVGCKRSSDLIFNDDIEKHEKIIWFSKNETTTKKNFWWFSFLYEIRKE